MPGHSQVWVRQVNRKALLWSAFFVVCLVAPTLQADSCAPVGKGTVVTSRAVIDGDTLELSDGRRVRLLGIDTPEIGRRGEPSEPYAQAAKKRLQALVREPGLRMYVGEEPRDRYGRILAHLFSGDGSNIEARLLEDGLGFALVVPPNDRLANCHRQAEARARVVDRGIWSQSPVVPAAQIGEGGFALIRGRIVSVTEDGGYLWLDLDGPVTLRISREEHDALPGMSEARAPKRWIGRTVEARGWVVDRRPRAQTRSRYKRFMLPVRHPLMLDIE